MITAKTKKKQRKSDKILFFRMAQSSGDFEECSFDDDGMR